jgi:uncharacterized protein YjiS (DUF1127 family)
MKSVDALMSQEPLRSPVPELLRLLFRTWEKAVLIRRLELLDDRQLNDIGFSRATLREVVRRGHR